MSYISIYIHCVWGDETSRTHLLYLRRTAGIIPTHLRDSPSERHLYRHYWRMAGTRPLPDWIATHPNIERCHPPAQRRIILLVQCRKERQTRMARRIFRRIGQPIPVGNRAEIYPESGKPSPPQHLCNGIRPVFRPSTSQKQSQPAMKWRVINSRGF